MPIKIAELKGFMRSTLAAAQDYRCYLCGEVVKPALFAGPDACTFDHVHPDKLYGRKKVWRFGNHLAAHAQCNHDKGARRPTGCEILFLFTTNRRLRYELRSTEHWDQVVGDCSAVLADQPCSR